MSERTEDGLLKAIEETVKAAVAMQVTHGTLDNGAIDLDNTENDKRVLKAVAVSHQEVQAVVLIPNGLFRMAKEALRNSKGTYSRSLLFKLASGVELLILPPEMKHEDKQGAVSRRGFDEAVANATPPRAPRTKGEKGESLDSQA